MQSEVQSKMYNPSLVYLYSESARAATPVTRPSFILPGAGLAHWESFGLYEERPVMEWAHQFIRPTGVMLDIGANVGTYSVEFAPRCRAVHAFEPQRLVYNRLCGALAINDIRNVYTYNVALGTPEQRGQMLEMTVMSADSSGSSLDPVKIEHERKIKPENILGKESVRMACLDDYDLHGVELLKIDVEGYELNVIRGGVELLRRNDWPRILFECWHEAFNAEAKRETLGFLAELGYNVVDIAHHPHMLLATHRNQAW